jgi:hypothetical protein
MSKSVKNFRYLLIAFMMVAQFIFSPNQVLAQEKDTLFLRGGHMLIGELKSVKIGVFEFDDVDLNIQQVKYHKIRTFRAVSNDYRIETSDKSVYIGKAKPSGMYGQFVIYNDSIQKTYKLSQIYQITLLEDGFWEKIHGSVAAGWSYTKSSNIGRWNFDANFNYTSLKFSSQITGSMIFTRDNGVSSRDREGLLVSGFYDVSAQNIIGLFFNYQRNIELGLARRFQQGGGFGKRLVLRDNLQGVLFSGLAVNQELSIEGSGTGNLYEIPLFFKLNFFNFTPSNISVSLNQNLFYGIDQNNRIRYDGETRIDYEIIKDLKLGFQFYLNLDSQPLNTEIDQIGSNTDYGMVFNVGYRF